MSDAWKQWEGHVVEGRFPLREFLGNTDHSAVFATSYGTMQEKAAIKFMPVPAGGDEASQKRWERTSKLAHPHLLRLFASGKCNLGDTPFVYVISEFAEENLAQILPQRALTAQETEFMLRSALEVLGYLHNSGLAHADLKPANLMAVGDNLKLSSESICPFGNRAAVSHPHAPYDAPELNATGPSAAADVWSLGVTLVEALTQKVSPGAAFRDGETLQIDGMPVTFLEIARQCLRLDPQRRWTTQEIAARLMPSVSTVKPRSPYIPAAVAVLALGVIFAGGKFLWQHGEQKGSADSRQIAPSPAAPGPPIRTEPSKDGPSDPHSVTEVPKPPVRKETPVTHATNPASSSKTTAAGAVLEKDVPSVSRRSRDTITGKVRVGVKVAVDPSGRVTNATLTSPGPSQYFAKVALDSSRRWKFSPPTRDGQAIASSWMLHYAFGRSGVDVRPAPASP